jgi:hypothetical protein
LSHKKGLEIPEFIEDSDKQFYDEEVDNPFWWDDYDKG